MSAEETTVNCHICHILGQENEAFAVCSECGAAVCQEHMEEAIVDATRDRLHLPGCSHGIAQTDSERGQSHIFSAPSTEVARAHARSR